MYAVASSPRTAPGFAREFPAERQYWERSANAGVTWAYNPAAIINHPGAAAVGTERYRLKFYIPAGLGGTFTFTISGDDWDGPAGVGGTLWLDGVQINANTGQGTVSKTVINTVPGPHILEWRHGNWTAAGATAPIMSFDYSKTYFMGY